MTTETKEKENRAKQQAVAKFELIREMLNRLRHAQQCDGVETKDGLPCDAEAADILGRLGYGWRKGQDATEEQKGEYHDEEKAREQIEESPLSVEVRSDWHTPGGDSTPGEYNILLCTGGPAVRIVGQLSEHGEPESARLEYQDWFTPWEEYRLDAEEETVVEYARCFYFGEG